MEKSMSLEAMVGSPCIKLNNVGSELATDVELSIFILRAIFPVGKAVGNDLSSPLCILGGTGFSRDIHIKSEIPWIDLLRGSKLQCIDSQNTALIT